MRLSRGRLTAAVIITPFLLVLTACVGLYFYLQTDHGRATLTSFLEDSVTDAEGLRLEIGRLEGNLFSDFTLASLILHDKAGPWLELQDLEVSWSSWQLLQARVQIDSLLLKSLDLARAPDLPDSPSETNSTDIFPLPVEISLGKVELASLYLGEPLLGQEARLSLSMNLRSQLEDAIHSELRIVQLDTGNASVDAKIDFIPATQNLAIDVQLAEPQGGLLARSLELPDYPAITLSLKGAGPLDNWRGEFLASAENLLQADALLKSGGKEIITFDLQGGFTPSENFINSLPLLKNERTTLESQLSWNQKTSLISLKEIQLFNSLLKTSGEGTVNLDEEALDLALSLELLDIESVRPLISPLSFDRATVDLSADGSFSALSLTAALQLGTVNLADTAAIEEIFATISSRLSFENLEHIPLNGTVALSEITGLQDQVTSVIGQELLLDMNLDYALTTGVIKFEELNAIGKHVTLQASGEADTQNLTAKATVSSQLDSLEAVSNFGGQLQANLQLESTDLESGLTGQVALDLNQFDLRMPELQYLAGENPSLTSGLSLGQDSLQLNNILLSLPVGSLEGSLTLPMDFQTVAGNFKTVINDLTKLNRAAGTEMAGKATLTTQLAGDLSNPSTEGRLVIEQLGLNGTTIGTLDSTFDIATLGTTPTGALKARLTRPQTAVDLTSDISLPEYGSLELTKLLMRSGDNQFSGELSIPFEGQPLKGQIIGTLPQLSAFSSFLGSPLSGTASLKIALESEQGQQQASLDLDAEQLSLTEENVEIQNLKVKARSLGALTDSQVSLDINSKGLTFDTMALSQLDLNANGKPSDLDYTFDLKGATDPRLRLEGSGDLKLGQKATVFHLARLNGEFADRKILLRSPLILEQSSSSTTLQAFELALGEGSLTASALLVDQSATAQLSLRSLPLNMVEIIVPDLHPSGTLEGEANLHISQGNSTGKLDLRASGMSLGKDKNQDLPEFTGTFAAKLHNHRVDFSADINSDQATTLTASGYLPAVISLSPFSLTIPEQQPVSAKLATNSDINSLWQFMASDTQILTGTLQANAELSGTLANSRLNGQASLSDGEYENIEFGTILRQLEFNADIQDSTRLLLKARAQDPKGGTLSSEGTVDLQDMTDPVVALTIQLDNLAALDHDQITLQTDGNINITGQTTGLNVTGDITTREVTINIDKALAPGVVELDVIEVNRPGASPDIQKDKPKAGSTVAMDLLISLPRRVFIRGRGLDSEWEGQFKVKGTADAPRVEGYLSPVRGQFSFAGKNFKLQQGKISLVGSSVINPELSLSAIYEASNVTAIVKIEGTASDPKITITSPDDLPQDEVLSQVLFGKAAGKLTAVEALQLATAVASLSGKIDTGGGILDFARDSLGVDVLTAGTNETTGAPEVSVGKYINDDIYIGVDQGAGAGSTRAKVQIELTPNVTVESETGQSAESKVGVYWKWDY
ncbi:translocation/assembly module TamB domain-containing protein [Kiloniella laminariae]|uniref:Translocation/assembly module TamB domain-containing protein n=1 Tax=Kiloniella laminariae TaxID=454162 RepID=A0ABT4LGT1_9PROT|nr:translocation/assembly module TamB domain-containing protein [Kiloniella laminariae]MCZ4280299.1 translocation/assembly module TamB domain-containing protein [Kiloniella laminariae]